MSVARSKLKEAGGGPSKLILIRQSRVLVFNWFLESVFIQFIAEKTRSHSAVLIGMRDPIAAK